MSLKIDRQASSSPSCHHFGSNQLFTKTYEFIPSDSEPSLPVTLNHGHKREQTFLNMLIDDSKQLQKNTSTFNSKTSLYLPFALPSTLPDKPPEEICSPNASQPKLYKLDTSDTFSTLRSRLKLSNQYIAGLHTRYTSQINNLQNISKNYRQKLSEYGGAIEEVKLENIKKGRELSHIKLRLQLLQQEDNNLRIRIKQCQFEKKKLHMLILTKSQDDSKDHTQEQNFKRGRDNRQKELKAVIDSMFTGMIELERQKQRVEFELNHERNIHEEQMKAWQKQMTEQKRLADHDKEVLQKRINKLQNKLKEKVEQLCFLENGKNQLQRSIQLDQKMRSQVQQLTYQLNSLKKSLSFAESSLSSTHKQIKSLVVENEQIRQLKIKIIEKEEIIIILRNKIIALQDIVEQLENKYTELQEEIHIAAEGKIQLTEDKKDLMEKIEQQKQSITKLIGQIQFFENASEIMNNQLIKKRTFIDRQREELSIFKKEMERNNEELRYKLKVIQQVLAEEQQKSSSIEALARNLKSKNNQLASEISKLSIERLRLTQKFTKLTEETSGIDHKNSMLQYQIFQLKGNKELKNSFFIEKIEELSKREQAKHEQIDKLNRQMVRLFEKIDHLGQENTQCARQREAKEIELQRTQEQLFLMRKEKFKIEQKLEVFHCQALNSQVKLHESLQQIQRLNKYIEDLQSHINQLDNILVWNFEEGRGENNNFQQRKAKMEQIVILLQQKIKQIEKLKKQCLDKDESIKQLDNTVGESQNLLAKFTQKLEKFIEEKESLTKMIEDIDFSNKLLIRKLAAYKENEVEWANKERALNKKLNDTEKQILAAKEQKAKIEIKLERWERQLKEKQMKIKEVNMQIAAQKEKNVNLKQIVDKLTLELKQADRTAAKKRKELTRQIDILKSQVEEKISYISQLQSDAKQQISHLAAQLNTLKSEIRDFNNFYQSEKYNYSKRNLLLVDFGTTLAKFQKVNCINSHLTHPLKDILRKMEQFDNYSSKLFAKYDKFQTRKDY